MDAPPPYEAVVSTSAEPGPASSAVPVDPPSVPDRPRPVPAPGAPSAAAPPPSAAAAPVSTPTAPAPIGPLPTQTPQWGHPLLYHNKLLVYPRYWTVCERCFNTGYKNAHASSPCGRCWRKFGREYAGALRAAYERPGSSTDLTGVHLQRPLEQVPNTAPFPTYVSAAPPLRPTSSPAVAAPAVFDEDRYHDAPPRYDLASQTAPNEPLPQQAYVHPGPAPVSAWGAPPPGPYRVGPTIDWYHARPPPGAVVVMPGDPRIGGVLCPQCGGSGSRSDLWSLFFSEAECERCSGTGRITR